MLVKIEKYYTKNPRPIGKSTMLVDRSGEKGTDKKTERKGDLFAKLNNVKVGKLGKGFDC